ncbi:secreted RxLR effector protein 161-like [Vicia villosa]|uniref:secreted RxLR effector protein 161-like n=1 Tax=Vicia villosa TaxID=3911 RepID=UPI00273AD025|nr:secreted RxLR effector protein 161-like [Vicia villosa]XP_058785228.1 secreted RxLR effector protein 161-like [Vicia villosa]
MEKPKVSHLAAIKRILRYTKGTLGCGILFSATDNGGKCELLGYTDSSWCGDKDDRKSTTGYVFMFGGAPISWCSKKESVVALSSCKAEYIIASLSINLAKNPIAHGRSKHIEMHFHYLRDLVSAGQLRLGYCRSEEQVADLLTKAVLNEDFKKLLRRLGMKNVEHLN